MLSNAPTWRARDGRGAALFALRWIFTCACLAALMVWGVYFNWWLAAALLALVAAQLARRAWAIGVRRRHDGAWPPSASGGGLAGAAVALALGIFVALGWARGVGAADHWVLTYSGMLPLLLFGLYPAFLLTNPALYAWLTPHLALLLREPAPAGEPPWRTLARAGRAHPLWAGGAALGGCAGTLALFLGISHTGPLHQQRWALALAFAGIVGTLLAIRQGQWLATRGRPGRPGRGMAGAPPAWTGAALLGYAAGELLGIALFLLLAFGGGVVALTSGG